MAATKENILPVCREIDGYIREMSDELHPKIIPDSINQIVLMFYDPVCYYFHSKILSNFLLFVMIYIYSGIIMNTNLVMHFELH